MRPRASCSRAWPGDERPGPAEERSAPAPQAVHGLPAGAAAATRWISSFPCKSFLSFSSFYFCLAFRGSFPTLNVLNLSVPSRDALTAQARDW